MGPANRPAFCRQVPLFYAKCPFKNILQVGRSASPMLTEAGTSVRLSFQSCNLLQLADESNGVTVRTKLFRDFNLLAAGWSWNSWYLASVVWRVCSMRPATTLPMSGGAIPASRCTLPKFVGLRQPEIIRQQSCRAGFSLCACVDLAPTGQAYSAAE